MNEIIIYLLIIQSIISLIEKILKKEILKIIIDEEIVKIIYIIITISGIIMILINEKETYIPFINDGIIPNGIIKEMYPENYEIEKKIYSEPGDIVIYWATEKEDLNEAELDYINEKYAYGNYENSGMSITNAAGVAILRIKEPREYYKKEYFGLKNKIERKHIKYRICNQETGEISKINKLYL